MTMLKGTGLAASIVLASAGHAGAQAPDVADLCKSRRPCTLVAATPAGSDAQGRALTVIELDLGKKNPDNASGDDRFDCRPHAREFWLRVAGEQAAQRFLSLCNDGYGAAGVGEDEIAVKPNLVEHAQNGGSAWRWEVTRTIRLAPLRVTREAHCSYHNVAPGFTTTVWDWQRFAGETRWTPKACSDKEAGPDAEMGCVPEKATRRYAVIPMLENALAAAGGRKLHLGTCAAAIDEGGTRGHVIFGAPRAGGAELRLLMTSPRDLVVSVVDDRFAAGAANWIHDDHIELWLGHGRTGLQCTGDKPANLRQWGIGLDGQVRHGHGAARAAAPRIVERLERRLGARIQVTLYITLPDEADGITVAYSKSVGGKQARLTATSQIRGADATRLGTFWRVEPRGVNCGEKEGAIDVLDSGLPGLLDGK